MLPKEVEPQWVEFLAAVDALLTEDIELHCLGGFVLSLLHELPRRTADIDVISVPPTERYRRLLEVAGEGSELHRRYHICVQVVGVAAIPEDYVSRLVEILPGRFKHLRLGGLEVHDLVLSKLDRNKAQDREDFFFLVSKGKIDPEVLARRYESELRYQLGVPSRGDGTLKFWLEAAFGKR